MENYKTKEKINKYDQKAIRDGMITVKNQLSFITIGKEKFLQLVLPPISKKY